MSKILRYSFMSLLLMCCGSIFADEATFDFTNPEGLKAMGVAEANIPTVEASAESGVPFETKGPFTVNGVTITSTDGGAKNADGTFKNGNRIWSPKGNTGTSYDYRVYGSKDNKGTITFTAPTGKEISKIELTTGTWNEPTPNVGSIASKTWSGVANSVTFTQEGQCQYKTVTVTFADAGSVTSKKDAGLSFSEETVNVVVGEPFTAPALSKATTADVTYSSTNTKVAVVDEALGTVEIVGAGTAKIRATTEENDEYYAGQAEYQIIATEPVQTDVTLPYEDLTGGQGSFTIDNVTLSEGLTYVWKWDSNNKYMKASAYVGGNKASESHLVSPNIDLGTATTPTLYFSQCINKYFGTYANEAKLYIAYDGTFDDIPLTAPTIESGNWSKWADEEIDLTAYAGKKIQVKFVYISTTTAAGTWEIKNFKVEDKAASGLNTIEASPLNVNAPMFNLAGQRVSKSYKGIVIQNGKKMIKK